MGDPDLYDTLRTADMASLVRNHFADEAVQGAYIAAPADPRQPGSPLEAAWASVPLEPDWAGLPVGGMGALASAMAEAAAGAGAEITTDAPVTRILVGDQGAAGVELQGGSRLDAGIVVSNLSPRATYTRLVDPGVLQPSFLDRVEGISSTIGYLKLHAGLREPMDLSRYLGPDHDPVAGSYMRITRSIDHYISAWEDCAAGRPARDPVIQLGTHTALDPGSAPPGGHAVSALVLYAPPRRRHASRWRGDGRTRLQLRGGDPGRSEPRESQRRGRSGASWIALRFSTVAAPVKGLAQPAPLLVHCHDPGIVPGSHDMPNSVKSPPTPSATARTRFSCHSAAHGRSWVSTSA